MAKEHPLFAGAYTRRDVREGLSFLVWDMHQGKFVEGGMVNSVKFMDSDYHQPEITYLAADGQPRKLDMAKLGFTSGLHSNWSHLISVPHEYKDRQNELPTIPKP